jgi:hypothetical protein
MRSSVFAKRKSLEIFSLESNAFAATVPTTAAPAIFASLEASITTHFTLKMTRLRPLRPIALMLALAASRVAADVYVLHSRAVFVLSLAGLIRFLSCFWAVAARVSSLNIYDPGILLSYLSLQLLFQFFCTQVSFELIFAFVVAAFDVNGAPQVAV